MFATVYFADWLKSQILRPGTPPALAMLEAVARGESLAEIEELVREKDFLLEFHELEQVLRDQAGLLASLIDTQAVDLPSAKLKLLSELKRLHTDIARAFKTAPDAAKYKALIAIAERAGLNASTFLDVLPALLFIDACQGELELTALLNLLRSEREACPERHEAREQALRRGRKHAIRETLGEAGLEAETVFDLLKTPYGPVRGEVMTKMHDLIREPDRAIDFGEHTDELRRRARVAHDLLNDRHLALD
jgi:hypothetical protein